MPRIMKMLNNISRCQASYRSEKLCCEGISACHHAFILTIGRAPGLTQEEVARELCLNKSTVTRTLAHLESHGYILRKSNPDDKREILVYPTKAMLEILPAVRAIARDWNSGITEGIAEEDMAVFYAVLQKLERGAKRVSGAQTI